MVYISPAEQASSAIIHTESNGVPVATVQRIGRITFKQNQMGTEKHFWNRLSFCGNHFERAG